MLKGALAWVLSMSSMSGVLATGLCSSQENAFFACSTARGQHIALCGRLPQKELQYRFGAGKQVEFRFPENKKSGMSKFMFASYTRYQTGRIEINFKNREMGYSVFDYEEEGQRFTGVRVVKPDGSESSFKCAGPAISRLGQLRGVLRCDPDSALNMMGCP